MPGLTPTRTEISDRFPVLGFRVRPGRNPYFEVAIATDPALFRADARAKRSADNFFSSHSVGPLRAENGETMYFIPPQILRHFAGKDRLFYTVASFPDTSRANPEILEVPDQARAWITISKSFTGRETRRLIGAPSSHQYTSGGNGYGKVGPDAFVWAGDQTIPGAIQRVEPAGGAIAATGKRPDSSQPAASSQSPADGNATKSAASPPAATASSLSTAEEIQYDDGYDPALWSQAAASGGREVALEEGSGATSADDGDQYGIQGPIPDQQGTDAAQAFAQPLEIDSEYPQADRFVAAGKGNFTPLATPRTINKIVIHITDGGKKIEGTINWFKDPNQTDVRAVDKSHAADCQKIRARDLADPNQYVVDQKGRIFKVDPQDENQDTRCKVVHPHVSAHYVIGQGGEVVQMVLHKDMAHHASQVNLESVGIEHVAHTPTGRETDLTHFPYPSDAQYCASAALVSWLCDQFNIPKDRDHIKGHNEASPKDGHTDCPNSVWDWDYYMDLITSGQCKPHDPACKSVGENECRVDVAESLELASTPTRKPPALTKRKYTSSKALEIVTVDYVPSDTEAALQAQLDFQNRKKQWFAAVPDTSFFPHSAICQLVDDKGGGGTGAYIAPDRILTAAHVVEGANFITVIPGKNGQTGLDGPFGHFTCPSSDWEIHRRRTPGNSDFDLAVLKVGTPPPGGQFFDILEELRQSMPSNIIVCGYSAESDKYPNIKNVIDPNKQHMDGDFIRTVKDETFQYNLQTLHGASGAPVYYVWAREDGERKQSVLETHLVGVHVSPFSETLNQGCRLTDQKIGWIQSVGQPISAGASAQGYSPEKKPARSLAPASRSYATAGNPPAVTVKPVIRSTAAGALQSAGSSGAQTVAIHKKTQTSPRTPVGVKMLDTAQDVASPPPQELAVSLKDADYAENVGESPDQEREPVAEPAAILLTNQAMYEIIRQVAAGHSGDSLYSAISTDREFTTPGQAAYQKRHFGLGFGLLLFTQESGQLGAALQLMHDRDPEQFSRIFGPDSDKLLATTNAETPEARLQPVGGENLWSPTWVSRFQAAGAYALYQAAQNEQAIEGVFRPLLHVAAGFGLVTDRLLAMALDVAVGRGLGGAIRWLAGHIGPFETSAQRIHAMETLGVDNLASFQAEVGWTPQDGQVGPETHAALAGALRRLEILPLPKSSDLACRMVFEAEGALKQRLLRLRDSTSFKDQTFAVN